MTNNFYREELLEHYKQPNNFGRPAFYDKSSKQTNQFCGDEIEVFVKLQRTSAGVIEDISFTGKGCVINIASASLLTEYAKGKTKTELTKFSEDDMLSLLGIQVSETRKKCAFLALSVLKELL